MQIYTRAYGYISFFCIDSMSGSIHTLPIHWCIALFNWINLTVHNDMLISPRICI